MRRRGGALICAPGGRVHPRGCGWALADTQVAPHRAKQRAPRDAWQLVDTLARWCSRPQDVTKHRAAFHERLAWFHSPPWVHARAADGAARRERGPEPRRGGQPGDGTGSANAHLEACRLWFVVDFHRSLQNGAVTRALRELSTDSRWMGAFGFAFGLAPRLCISWRLRVRRAASWLRAAFALEDTELQ